MKYRSMGKLGIKASAFGLGCMRFNGAPSGDCAADKQKAIAAILSDIQQKKIFVRADSFLKRTTNSLLNCFQNICRIIAIANC